jgi:uncharacterized protein YjbI with pentapeptide repeats
MRIIKPFNQSLLTKVFEAGNKYHLAVTILNGFRFGSPLPLLPEQDLWKFAGAELGKDAILDEAMPKARAEVLVRGKCHAPTPAPIPAGEVHLEIATVRKSLYVFGDRFWHGLAHDITKPVPFLEMDLAWANAFGGPEVPTNPIGKGTVKVKTPAGEALPLPNVEDHKHLITSPKDRPIPVGLMPYDLTWPQRMNKAGTYNDKWLRELYPGYAADMDPTFFNTAPPDQWLSAFFAGDETFTIKGMHPTQSILKGRLPALRCRCFIEHPTGPDATLIEIGTHADTVWLFPAAETGIVVYRGVIEIHDDEAADVNLIVVGYERMSDPARPPDHYRQAMLRRLDPENGAFAYLDERDLIAEGETPALLEMLTTEQGTESPFVTNMKRRAERLREKGRAQLAAVGLDPDKLLPPAPPPAAPPNLLELPGMMATLKAEAETKRQAAVANAKAIAEKLGVDFDQLTADAKKKAGKRPTLNVEPKIAQMRQVGVNRPDLEEKLRATEEQVTKAYRRYAQHFPEPGLPDDLDPQKLRQEVIAAVAAKTSLSGRDLMGADLSKLDLKNIDLSDAYLEKVNFAGADLTGANLSGAVITYADFSNAKLADANLQAANFGASNLCRADFSRANLEHAVLSKTDLNGANFTGATVTEAEFFETKLAGADFSQAKIGRAIFNENDFTGAKLAGADFSESVFLKANFTGVDATGADLHQAVFMEVNADKARFTRANLTKSMAAQNSRFEDADFEAAVLKEAGWMEVNLVRANFKTADLTAANFMSSDLSGADLYRAVAVRARFDKADLTGARMVSINLLDGSLRKTRLINADLSGANLCSCELFRTKIGSTNFNQANLELSKLEKWKPR